MKDIWQSSHLITEFLVPGFMQFVQSVPVAEVLATEGNIQVSNSQSKHSCLLPTNTITSHFDRVSTELLQETRTE